MVKGFDFAFDSAFAIRNSTLPCQYGPAIHIEDFAGNESRMLRAQKQDRRRAQRIDSQGRPWAQEFERDRRDEGEDCDPKARQDLNGRSFPRPDRNCHLLTV